MKLRKSGKVITTFRYTQKGVDIELELRLQKVGRSEKLEYRVQHDEPQIDMAGADPEELRKRVLGEMHRLMTITWQRVLVILTDSDMNESQDDVEWSAHSSHLFTIESKVEVELYEFGTTSAGGHVHRKMCQDGTHYSTESDWPYSLSGAKNGGRYYTGKYKSVSFVPWTEENVKRLMAIRAGYRSMAAMLSELLGKDRAQATLENVRVLGLPTPAPKKDNP